MTGQHSIARAVLRGACLLSWTLGLLLPSLIALLLIGRAPTTIIRLWHRGAIVILDLDIELSGKPAVAAPALFVANHISYLDILVLGAMLNPAFVAKSEVGDWPVIGWLAHLVRTVFVDRQRRSSRQQRDAVAERLAAGESLVLFPEGTSSDGTKVLPFKSTLFSAVEAPGVAHRVSLQPITLAYGSHRKASPIDKGLGVSYAWYGDMDLLPHLWLVLGLPGAHVSVLLHDVLQTTANTDRKHLAAAAERVVGAGLRQIQAASRADAISHEAAGIVAGSSSNRRLSVTTKF